MANGYTDYVQQFEDGTAIQKVFANTKSLEEFAGYEEVGDIYNFRSDAEKDHSGERIIEGYIVVNLASGLVANGCRDWCDTVDNALKDRERHLDSIKKYE